LFFQPSVGAKASLASPEYMIQASDNCFWLLAQAAPVAFNLALASAGKSMPARIAMIAMTTSSSMRVNPSAGRRVDAGVVAQVFMTGPAGTIS